MRSYLTRCRGKQRVVVEVLRLLPLVQREGNMRSALVRRGAALVAASALSITTLGALASPAQAHPAGDRAVNAGATWVKGQLTNGLVVGQYQYNGATIEYEDYGLSADFAFALAAVGGNDSTVVQIADAVAPKVTSWYDSFGTIYTGSAAKAAALAQTAGKDPSAFGGQNLIDVVEDRVGTTDPIVGRVQNEGEFDYNPPYGPVDSLNVISQGWAARALTTAGSAKAGSVTDFLLDQQCAEGFFRATLTADKMSTQQGCATGDAPSVDTTALTIINLLDTPGAPPAARTAASTAASWLATQQAADGSFSAGGSEGYNANSTGLAGWALAKTGNSAAAIKAAGWLRGVQISDLAPCVNTLATENGAIAYKPSTLATARTSGSIAAGQRDSYRRATAQALPALANVPAGTGPLSVSAPATAVEKSTVTVTVSGLGAGETGCVSFGSASKSVTGTGGSVTATFVLPAGVASHTFTLRTLAGLLTATTSSTLTPVPVPATPEVGELQAATTEIARNDRFKLALTCDDTEVCEGKIVVRTARKVRVDGAAARTFLISRKAYSVKPGTTEKLVLTVRKAARPTLDDGRIRVKAIQIAPDADRAVTKFWLRAK